jgi:hypothetical protein
MFEDALAPLRPLGRVALTPEVRRMLSDQQLLNALLRHMRSGESRSGTLRTIDALPDCRVLSVYRTPAGETILVITEADRTRTTLLLAREYLAV